MLQKVLTFIKDALRSPKENLEESTKTLPIVPIKIQPMTPQDGSLLESDQEEKLSQLYPPFAEVVRRFIHEARYRGMLIAIFEGRRTFERQTELYLKGRDSSGNVIDIHQVVTNAPAGFSMHQYGLAVDLVFDGNLIKPGWQWSWDNKHPWRTLANLGRGFGLESAYFWKRFPECPHFQLTYGFKEVELLKLYKEGGINLVWKTIATVDLSKHLLV